MPPKKRKAASALPASRGKRVRIGSSSIVGEDEDSSVLSASGRPRRSTAGAPNYDLTRRNRSSLRSEPAPKKVTPPSRTTKRGPGRPQMSPTPKVTASSAVNTKTSGKKPLGRPPRIATHVELPVRKRGRPKKEIPSTVSSTQTVKKATPKTLMLKKTPPKHEVVKKSLSRQHVQDLVEDSTGAIIHEADWEEVNEKEEAEPQDEDRQFWLMKAEPDSRIVNGVDVGFSIDTLMSRTEPEGWDGVRNFVARNNMRAMRENDLAFFYHSNCAIPGIAGIMKIVQEHSIDESAFDPSHPYYDPKSTDRNKPKWELVHVMFAHKFDNLIGLKELKAHAGCGQPLENLQTLKQSRLSVTSVSTKEWNFIMDLSGEDFGDQHNGESDVPAHEEADDTLKGNGNDDLEVDVEDGPGAFDLDMDVGGHP